MISEYRHNINIFVFIHIDYSHRKQTKLHHNTQIDSSTEIIMHYKCVIDKQKALCLVTNIHDCAIFFSCCYTVVKGSSVVHRRANKLVGSCLCWVSRAM